MAETSVEAAPAASPPLIELEGLTKHYGALVAVDDVSMRVVPGEVRAVIGPTAPARPPCSTS